MFGDGQQDVERRRAGEQFLQRQADDAGEVGLPGGQLVVGVAVQRPGGCDLLQGSKPQRQVRHVLHLHGGKLHAQQGSQLGLGDVAAHGPVGQHQPGQRGRSHDLPAQVGVELPGVVQRLVRVDVYPREGGTVLLGGQRELKFSGRILAGDSALRGPDLFQHPVQRRRPGGCGGDGVAEVEVRPGLDGLDFAGQQAVHRAARHQAERQQAENHHKGSTAPLVAFGSSHGKTSFISSRRSRTHRTGSAWRGLHR